MAWSITKLLKAEIAECPECACKIPFHKTVKLGAIVICPECREQFEVCSLDPLELDWIDFDDDDFEEWV